MEPCRNSSPSAALPIGEITEKRSAGERRVDELAASSEALNRQLLDSSNPPAPPNRVSLLETKPASSWSDFFSYYIPSWRSAGTTAAKQREEEREAEKEEEKKVETERQEVKSSERVEECLLCDQSMRRGKKYLYVALSLAGGGSNGQSQAVVLQKIEKAVGKPIGEVVDQVTGTSAGGISGSLLLIKEGDNWKHSADELRDKLKTIFPKVFRRGPIYSVTSLNGYGTKAKYPDDGLNETLREWYGDVKLSELGKEFMAPVVLYGDLTDERKEKSISTFEFRRCDARRNPERDLPLREVMRAVPAAESYFTAMRKRVDDKEFAFADGGIYDNYPISACYFEASELFKSGSDMILCYVGTGERHKTVTDKTLNGGAATYITSIGGINGTCTELAEIRKVRKALKENLFVFNPDVERVSLDETGSQEIARLEEETDEWLKNDSVRRSIEEMADRLEENYQRRPTVQPWGMTN